MESRPSWPFITADLPGLGGRIKTEPGRFVVEEIPLYDPADQGDHIYVRLSREGHNTRDLVRNLAGCFGLRDVDVGCAGQKDKNARVTQTFSLYLPGITPDRAAARIEAALPVRVLWARRHQNKLRTGHLLGNRFSLVLTEPHEDGPARARAIIRALQDRGLPNFYGVQRFGVDGDNALRGREVLMGRGPRQRWLRRFLLSAYQAELFNAWLAERMARGWFDRLLTGDLAKKLDTGGLFEVTDPDLEQPRMDARTITYTGPIYGMKMRRAGGEAGDLEREIQERFEVTGHMLGRARLEGSRRPARLFLSDIEMTVREPGLVFEFSLPKGAYATTVMRELMKVESDLPGDPP